MKVLTACQMRQVDQQTIALGIPGIVLMENAAHRVVEEMVHFFGPLSLHRIAVLCGKGNNGGDGLAVARLLFIRHQPLVLNVILLCDPAQLRGDALTNLQMLIAAGVPVASEISPRCILATIVVVTIVVATTHATIVRTIIVEMIIATIVAGTIAIVATPACCGGVGESMGSPRFAFRAIESMRSRVRVSGCAM